MIKIGILGVGHLGKIHAKLLKDIPAFELMGFYDPDPATVALAQEYGITYFSSEKDLVSACDAVDIVTNTGSHYSCATMALRAGKHVFIEKPVCSDTREGNSLQRLAEEAKVKVQVGHIERFNPALESVQHMPIHPLFIEAHRLSVFNVRGTDVSVVMDLMIHDIDIILKLVNSNIKRISANGVAVVSTTPDIANARLEFDNGCVANVTASRLSFNNMRKMRVFQRDAYISIDFLAHKSEIIRLSDNAQEHIMSVPVQGYNGTPQKYLSIERPEVMPQNALRKELELFAGCIINDTEPSVTLHDALRSLQVAERIQEKIAKHTFA